MLSKLDLGGTLKTSGCSSVTPTASSFIKVWTQVRTGLRWAGTGVSHDLRSGRVQSGPGGGRSEEEERFSPAHRKKTKDKLKYD